MDFIRAWIQNLLRDLLIIVAVCVGMLIFLRIFYPDTMIEWYPFHRHEASNWWSRVGFEPTTTRLKVMCTLG